MTSYKSSLIILSVILYLQTSLCTEADITEFPAIVSLRFKDDTNNLFKHICSGSIINSSVVLTSASCFPDEVIKLSSYQIVAASDVFDGSTGSVALIDRVVKHYEYKKNSIAADLAIVFLKTQLYIDNAKTAAPSLKEKVFNEETLLDVSGWNSGAQPGSLLQKNKISVQYCDNKKRILCGISTSICESGPGSLLWENMQLVGILSKNGDCDNGEESFTSILASMNWFNKALNGETIILKPEFL